MSEHKFNPFNESMGRIGLLCHPLRYNIMKELYESVDLNEQTEDYLQKSRWYLQKLADEMNVPRQPVSFHLTTLEENDLVASELGVIKKPLEGRKGLAGRFYHITYIGIIAFEELKKAIKELEANLETVDEEVKYTPKFYLAK